MREGGGFWCQTRIPKWAVGWTMRKVQSLCGQRRSTDRVPIQARALFWCPVVLHGHAPNRSYVKRALLKRHAFRLFFFFFFSCQQDHCKCSMGSAWPGIPTLPAVQMTIRLYASPQKENRYSFGYPVTSWRHLTPLCLSKKKNFHATNQNCTSVLDFPPPSSCSVDCHRTICIF